MPDKGVRKVQLDEMEKMKGLHGSRYTNLSYQILATSIEQHVYAAISVAIAPTIIAPRKVSNPSLQNVYDMVSSGEATTKPTSKWAYSAPDLSINKAFYQDRIKFLKAAIKILKLNYHATMKQGREILEAHRRNYGPKGPKHLVIL